MTQQENATSSENNTTTATSQSSETEEKQKEYVDQQGNGLIKGSRSGIYHLPGLNTTRILPTRKNGSKPSLKRKLPATVHQNKKALGFFILVLSYLFIAMRLACACRNALT